MDDFVLRLIVGLVGAGILWLIGKYYHRPRLYCAASLYTHSTLATHGSTVQLRIANKGRKPEEGVEVQLSHDYEYSLIAHTEPGVAIDSAKSVVLLPTLLPKAEISLLVLAEGKPRISKEGIVGIRSKTSRGSVGTSMAEAEAASPGAVFAAIVLLLFVAVFGYGAGKLFGEDAWYALRGWALEKRALPFVRSCSTGFSYSSAHGSEKQLSESELMDLLTRSATVQQVAAIGDTLYVAVEVAHQLDQAGEYSLTLQTPESDSSVTKYSRHDGFIHSIILQRTGQKRTYELSGYYKVGLESPMFWLEIRLATGGYSLSQKHTYLVNTNVSLGCDHVPAT